MAQMASRSSVELYTNLFFKGKEMLEEGYINRVLKNGFNVIIPKYGIEGFVFTTLKKSSTTSLLHYDFETLSLKSEANTDQADNKSIQLCIFSKVKVLIHIDDPNVRRTRLHLQLVSPYIPFLSPSLEAIAKINFEQNLDMTIDIEKGHLVKRKEIL